MGNGAGKSLEHKSCEEEQLRDMVLFSVKKRCLRGGLIALYNHLKVSCGKVRVGLFCCVSHVRGNGLASRKVQITYYKTNFTERVVRHWTELPREVVGSPSLESFKSHLDVALVDLV